MKMRSKYLLLLILTINNLYAQEEIKYLTISDYYKLIMEYHPVAKQAALLPEQARQDILTARGGFDPKITSNFDNKVFKGTEYYKIWENSLKVPIWFASDFKVGYDQATGQFLNPENRVPSSGLGYAGISVNVGRGLFIDERRAILRQARLLRDMNEAERVKIINKLIYDAAKEYWEWYFAYQRYKFIRTGVELADARVQFVRQRIAIGEEPPIDSTEAIINYQNRLVAFEQAKMDYINSNLRLSNFLWNQQEVPVELDTNVLPQPFVKININKDSLVESLTNNSRVNHPEIIKLNRKIDQITIERRLAFENFKPGINLNYNVLWPGNYSPLSYERNDFYDNYKAGFEVNFPLLFRKERAKWQTTKIKMQQTKFERAYTLRFIQNNIKAFGNELQTYYNLLNNQSTLVTGYTVLRDGEATKFDNGESSLFLVNTRENSLIEAQIKLAEIESKFEKARAGLYWAAGQYTY